MPRRIGRTLVPALLVAVVAAIAAGCAPTARHFTHDLPEIYRMAIFDYGKAATVEACSTALSRDGYSVAFSDTTSGIVFTSPRRMPPPTPEIGGEWEVLCFLRTTAIEERSIVSAEIVAQAEFLGDPWPMNVSREHSRALYRDLFRKIQVELESGERKVGK